MSIGYKSKHVGITRNQMECFYRQGEVINTHHSLRKLQMVNTNVNVQVCVAKNQRNLDYGCGLLYFVTNDVVHSVTNDVVHSVTNDCSMNDVGGSQ